MKNITQMRQDDVKYNLIIQDLINHWAVQKMNDYKQHCQTSCLEHCLNVSYISYLICKKYNLDYVSSARAGLLHDLFLYDWREKQENAKGLHAFTHPGLALRNSSELFHLNKKEKDIIKKHMWPVTITLPKYKESYIITFVDKYCALFETYDAWKENWSMKMLWKELLLKFK